MALHMVAFMYLLLKANDCLQITTCGVRIAGESCDITCKTADLSHVVIIYKNLASMGSCLRIGDYNNCKGYQGYEISQDEKKLETVLTIQSLDVNADTGLWHCAHKTDISEKKELHVYDFRPTFTFFSLLSGGEDLREENMVENNSTFMVRLCIYPEPTLVCRCRNQQIPCTVNDVKTVPSQNCTGQLLQLYEMTGFLQDVCIIKDSFVVNIDIKIHNQVVESIRKKYRMSPKTDPTSYNLFSTVLQHTTETHAESYSKGPNEKKDGIEVDARHPVSGGCREEERCMLLLLSLNLSLCLETFRY